jgi:hypothetical protein
MKYSILILNKNEQKQVQVDAPKVDFNLLLSECIESFKNTY